MILYMRTKCPYCDHEQTQCVKENSEELDQEVVLCDATDGGCDKLYVAIYEVTVSAESYTIGDEATRCDEKDSRR